MARAINEAGKKLIKEFEGLRLKPYLCEAGKWTIGYGHTDSVYVNENTKPISAHQADVILGVDLARFEEWVDTLTPPWLNTNQFSACVALMFNIGIANFTTSTLLKRLNAGAIGGAADQFLVWNKVTKKDPTTGLKRKVISKGLISRRKAERDLFLKPVTT